MGMPMPDPTLGGEAPADPSASPDDSLRNWIYVDFAGKPLMAADLATSPDAQLVHLVPFVMRAIVDERKLDALLVDLASAPVPIDVRQVRINPGTGGAGMGGPGMGGPGMGMQPPGRRGEFEGPGMPGGPTVTPGSRPNDVTVELRGTVALATPPDRQALGLEAAADEGGVAAEEGEAMPDDGGAAPGGDAAGADEAAEPAAANAGGEQP
jgi:hypothetical protein